MRQGQHLANEQGVSDNVVSVFERPSAASRQLSAEHAAVLEGVRRVAEKAAPRSVEIDEAGQFPRDLFDELDATGAFYAMAPRAYGGVDMPLHLVNEVIFTGARAYGSLGWLLMVGTAQGLGYGFFPKEAVDEMQANTPQPRLRGAIAPKGRAVPVDGGYRVSGQWPFASGGPDPDYVAGNCIVFKDGKPVLDDKGLPEAIIAVLPASEAKFLDTWHVLGMRGTDSCDVAFEDVFVPKYKTYNIFTSSSFFDIPAARLPLRVALSFGHVSVALGIAQGAIDDIVELAKTKAASMNPNQKLRDDPVFRHALGEHSLRLTACKSLLTDFTAKAWRAGVEGRPFTPEETLTGRLLSAYVTFECVKIVDWAYTAGGSSSVYDKSSLQRRFRDIHVATQHASCHTDPYRVLGGVLLGDQPSPMELF